LTQVFLTQSYEIFFTRREKIEKFGIFGENFPDLEVADPSSKKK